MIGTHAHVVLLLGLSPLLVNLHLVFWTGGALIMNLAMGWAGLDGMLRHTLDPDGMYATHMTVAMVGGIIVGIGFLCLLANLVLTLGVGTIVGAVSPFVARQERRASEA